MNHFNSNPHLLSLHSQLSLVRPANQPILVNSAFGNNLYNLKVEKPSLPFDLNHLLCTLQLRQNIQTNLFKMQMTRLLELKSSLLNKFNQQQDQSFKYHGEDASLKTVSSTQDDSVKEEALFTKEESASSLMGETPDLKQEIKNIIIYVLENYGRINEAVFNSEKAKYSHNKDLSTVFDLLTSKYSSTIKTKEEMVKYILRKAFKFVKNNLKKGKNTNKSSVSKALCDKYFHASQEDISKSGNEDLFLKSILPFRKDSKNKTMNTSFIHEIFGSEDFSRDYQYYLENFENILEIDNCGKLGRFVEAIKQLISEGKINNISKYKRIPWPKIWILNTMKIAQDLPNLVSQQPPTLVKKIK
jgi:hypothetical protein